MKFTGIPNEGMKRIAQAMDAPATLTVEGALEALVRGILLGTLDQGVNPYFIPEVKEALQALAEVRGIENWRDAIEIDHY